MKWDDGRVREVAKAYRRFYQLSTGDRSERGRADDYWWSWELVTDGATDGSLPVEVIDALLHHPDADDAFRGYVAAGPMEDALTYHPTTYGPAFAAKCDADSTWADTIDGVWLDDPEWSALPEVLRARIPVHSLTGVADPHPGRKPRSKKPSKRQGKRPRHN